MVPGHAGAAGRHGHLSEYSAALFLLPQLGTSLQVPVAGAVPSVRTKIGKGVRGDKEGMLAVVGTIKKTYWVIISIIEHEDTVILAE